MIVEGFAPSISVIDPEALLEIIILLAFLKIPGLLGDGASEFQVLEFFAGAARIARMGRAMKLKTGALDRDMDASMDLNTSAGFLLLVVFLQSTCGTHVAAWCISILIAA